MKVNKTGQKKTGKETEKNYHSAKSPVQLKKNNQEKTILYSGLIIVFFAVILYSNTLTHRYALDDFPVIYGNTLTMQGLNGIPTLLKTGYWFGLDGKNDFLYRPLSLVTYAIEWEISPNNPPLGHFTNIFLYALTGFLLFRFLTILFRQYNMIIPFLTMLIFMVHPLHTEVVANIKSRDEILYFLFFIISADMLMKYSSTSKIWQLVISGLCFFLSLLSKESAITFLAFYPLMFYFFTDVPIKKNIILSSAMVFIAAIYLVIRSQVITAMTTDGVISILDNTMAAAPDLHSRLATAFYILGLYIKLLIFPHPLACDYSYHQINIVTFTNPLALASLIFYLFITTYAIINFTKKGLITFGIIFYLVPLSLVANIFFLTRSTMADRFMYTPSLGFCLVISVLLVKFLKIPSTYQQYESISMFLNKHKKIIGISMIILIPFSFKTIARNMDWKNDYSIFSADSKTSSNSSRIHFLFANHLIQSVKQNIVPQEKIQEYLQTAEVEMKEAVKIYPKNFEALSGLGELYTTTKAYDKALESYQSAVNLYPAEPQGLNNLGNTYFRLGKYKEAFDILNQAINLNPQYSDSYNNIGSVYFATGQYQQAADVYKKAISLRPNYAEALKNLGSCYGMLKDYDNAIIQFNKAVAIDPGNPDYYNNLAITYQFKGDSLSAQTFFAKAQQATAAKSNKVK